MGERRVRVGVIGAGTFAEECHVPGIQAHPRGEVVALCARDRARVTALAERLGVPAIHTDYREMLARADIDAVTIATPDALHLPVALAAFAAGKHVFCEKPLAMNADEARRMATAADSAGLIGMVAFTFRYSRALQAVRALLAENAIGTPFSVTLQVHWGAIGYPGAAMTWREQRDHSSGGIWADGASHLFDALAYVLAPVEQVCAQMMVVPRANGVAQPDNVDLAMCLGRLRRRGASADDGQAPPAYADRSPDTVHVALLTSRVDRPEGHADELQVVGTAGALRASLTRGGDEYVRLARANGAWEDVALPDDARTGQPLALTRMMGAFVNAVERGRLDSAHDADFAAGLHAQQAIDAALRSALEERWVEVS